MTALKYAAYGAFVLAGLVAFGAVASEAFMLLGGAIWAGLMGLLLLAANRALTYLREIRDHVVDGPVAVDVAVPSATAEPAKPPRSLDEIEQDIVRMKARAVRD